MVEDTELVSVEVTLDVPLEETEAVGELVAELDTVVVNEEVMVAVTEDVAVVETEAVADEDAVVVCVLVIVDVTLLEAVVV
jgi:hypothetical protein